MPPRNDTTDNAEAFEIPLSQKLLPAGFAVAVGTTAGFLIFSNGYLEILGWIAAAAAAFQAIQSAVFFAKSEVCRIENGTLFVHVGPLGNTRVDLEDIIEIESESPFLSLRAHSHDDDDTRLVQISTNVLTEADRQRLRRRLTE